MHISQLQRRAVPSVPCVPCVPSVCPAPAPAPTPHARAGAAALLRPLVVPLLAVMAACSGGAKAPNAVAKSVTEPDSHAMHARMGNDELTPQQLQAVAQVRNATARFHDIAVAKAAGYTTQYPAGCSQSAAGAQAYHYLNDSLVNDKVELLHPELLMYEPQPNGSLQLVGVDYVVPLAASAEPPTLLGVPFMRNEPLGVWALHIWAWRPNPSGMFAAWNPKVSCAYAK